MERRVINRITLINKLNSMTYENISEVQMHMMFRTIGNTIEVDENSIDVKDDIDCNMN